MHRSGRHFLQIPGPTNTPDRVLRAMAQPTIDHRSAEFAALGREVLDGLKRIFQTAGAGGDLPRVRHRRLGSVAGQYAVARRSRAGVRHRRVLEGLGRGRAAARASTSRSCLETGATASIRRPSKARLRDDRDHRIRAVLVVHNETSTGVTSRLPEIRRAIDRAGHPALLLVDAVSSLGSIDLRHDEWGLDVTLAGSQKGLMLPPGLSFNAISEKALAASRSARLPRSYFAWEPMLRANATGFFPYTPATNLLFGLREALAHARRGRAAERLRAAPAAGGGGARGRARLGPRDRLRASGRVQPGASRPS